MQKIKIIHFHNGTGGGVLSVIKNLLKFSINSNIENHVIFTINKDQVADYKMPLLEGATTQQIFYYSPKWNFYYTCKQLAKLLPDEQSVVVAHDWLELGMMSQLGLQNPAVQIVHGNYDYYYDLAKKHGAAINSFICISPVIYKNLYQMLPLRIADIKYCRFPVPSIAVADKKNDLLKIFYCVRNLDDDNKQFQILPKINALLKEKSVSVQWMIVGDGIVKEDVEKLMAQQSNLSVFPSLSNEEVINLLQQQDIFILPSLKEGFPVAVVEAMKAGLVPLVTNWDGATEELIVQGETGFYFEPGDANGYAKTIELLDSNRALLNKIAAAGRERANELFDPLVNTRRIEDIIINAVNDGIKNKSPKKIYGSRLDNQFIPNFVTHFIRNYL
ncbi:MAG: glycosyltransferase family 4 protein [Bacteroidetes bacterium]|nr:glycosyltransferase family 4 protein [Bacteroidota bacterium]